AASLGDTLTPAAPVRTTAVTPRHKSRSHIAAPLCPACRQNRASLLAGSPLATGPIQQGQDAVRALRGARKPHACHGLAGIATSFLVLISREPMQMRLARALPAVRTW